LEAAFAVKEDLQDTAKTGLWVGDCFLYTNNANRLNYFVGGEIVTVAHLDKPMYLLRYLPDSGRAFLGDRDLNIVSYHLPLEVLEYQTAVLRGMFGVRVGFCPCLRLCLCPGLCLCMWSRHFHVCLWCVLA